MKRANRRTNVTDTPTIEVLYFDGCPSHGRLLPTVEQLAAQFGVEVRFRRVETPEAAESECFSARRLRVNGIDVDSTALERTDFGLKCRIYRSDEGQSPLPPEQWIRVALRAAARASEAMARIPDLRVTEIAGQVRSTAVDLVRASEAAARDEAGLAEASRRRCWPKRSTPRPAAPSRRRRTRRPGSATLVR